MFNSNFFLGCIEQPDLSRDQPRDAASQRDFVEPASRSFRRKNVDCHRRRLHRMPLDQVKNQMSF